MFERRLKILLVVLLVASAALAIRAAQIQIIQHNLWRTQATEIMKRGEFIETTRGSILDRRGQTLACDAPCIDACVDYRAITEEPDDPYVRERAAQNLRVRLGRQFKDARHLDDQDRALLDEECDHVRADIAAMWSELAAAGGKTPEQIGEIRRDIVRRVEMRKRYIWWYSYEQAIQRSKQENSSSWYRQFLSDSSPDESAADQFEVEVGEETSPHVILHNVPPEIQARLARQEERFFCLSLQPSKYRQYPFGRAACNVLGYLDTARPEETTADAGEEYWTGQARRLWPGDWFDRYGVAAFRELRKYWPNDQAGRAGVESLCESTLRGTRGKIDRVAGTDQVVDQIDAAPGKNVSLSIDVLLQQDIENEFVKTRVHKDDHGQILDTRFNQHGAAVVMKVDTGEILALVSNPGYDLNDLDARYSELAGDELNRPLLDRATELAVVPGSTVKPILGSGSITDHIMKATDKIQCRGELIIDGKPQPHGHCWIYAALKDSGAPISHRTAGDPNIGPDDMLSISDGIKDSCNVVFENVALRMGIKKLYEWYDRFGLGRRTGIGIEESPGLLFGHAGEFSIEAQTQTWSLGIGEGHIQTTPIQMANVAATIARNGVWMRPRIVADQDVGRFSTRRADPPDPDRVDLHLSPEALSAVQTGMREVCTPTGSGYWILPENIDRGPDDPPVDQDPLRNIQIAGKTGSAQTGGFMTLILHDAQGKPVFRQVHFGDPGTQGWYIQPTATRTDNSPPEKHLAHAWFMGYAPAEHPQIAFCVLVEYGEGGGRVAGPIAHDLLVDCIKRGYLSEPRM
ncbi:MAG: penicillin-binding transpeptidase domain-containing protein [Tepidisphaeraceae bacterium]|jgi:penicillin-binding protein 2